MPKTMTGILRVAAAGAVALIVAACASTPTVKEVSEDDWFEARTPNFVVLTNAGEARARYLAQNLEDFRRLVIEATNLEIQSNPMPFHVVALSQTSEFRALLETDEVFGAFQHSYRGGLAVVNLTARAPDGTDSLEVIQTPYGPIYRAKQNTRVVGMDGVFHEYVHYLLEIDKRRRYPLWFHEGYAEYLSTFEIASDGRYRIGSAPMHRVLSLEKVRWIPLGALFNARGYETGHANGDFNAESWLIVHYLMDNPERRERLYAFLDRLNTPTIDTVPAFEEVFGEEIEDFGRTLRQYKRAGKFDVEKFDRPEAPLPSASVRRVPVSEAKEQLAFALLHFTPAMDKGRALLEEALATDPDDPQARALLAAIAITDDRLDEARRILSEAGPALKRSPDLLVMQGELVLREAARQVAAGTPGGPMTAVKAAGHFRRAMSLEPDNAQAMLGLARCWLLIPGPPPSEPVAVLDRALALLPTNTDIILIKAHVLLKQGDIQGAMESYERVIAWGREPEVVRQARERLDGIKAIIADYLEENPDKAP
jgi:tetratricopeptide (TPR) repeat protein